jgi:ribonuclease T2
VRGGGKTKSSADSPVGAKLAMTFNMTRTAPSCPASCRKHLLARIACATLMLLAAAMANPASAQDRRQNAPGQFDYYLLVLSWSPSFCAANAERSSGRSRPDPQCGARPFSFVVHGLWPQYERRGFPEFCQVPAPRLARSTMSAMLDLMPSPNLIYHEWDRHGTCSGMPASAYFDTIRKARAVVKIPPQFLDVTAPLTVTPDEIADAFAAANPDLAAEDMSIACGGRRLSEIRLCMTRELGFRDCPRAAQRSCRSGKIVMPPMRGG